MRALTIKAAKARLNELVDAATKGEQVVLLRGSRHVAALVPITDADLEFGPRLTDAQAERFWQRVELEKASDASRVFLTPADAVRHLASLPRRRRAPRTSRS